MPKSKWLNENNSEAFITYLKSLKEKGLTADEIEDEIFKAGWRSSKGKGITRSIYDKELKKPVKVKTSVENLIAAEQAELQEPVIVSENFPPVPEKDFLDSIHEELPAALIGKAPINILFTEYEFLHKEGEAYRARWEKIKQKMLLLSAEDKIFLLTKIYWHIPGIPDEWLVKNFGYKSLEDMRKGVGAPDDVLFKCTSCESDIKIKTRVELSELHEKSESGLKMSCRACRRLQELRDMDHRDYIKTPEWQTIRLTHLAIPGNDQCRICCKKDDIDVHHNNYANKGKEKPEDLVTLCHGPGGCHGIFHAAKKLVGVYDTGTIWAIKKKGTN